MRDSRLQTRIRRAILALLLLTCGSAGAGPGSSAFLQSLLVPGWGQYSLGDRRTALGFFGAEVLMLGGLLTLQSYGESTRDDYEAFAAAHAGVRGSHEHDYYVDVGNWMSVYDFNNQRLLERNYGSLYTSDNDFWQWDSDANRAKMEDMRIRSDRAFNSLVYIGAGMVLNHLVSAIHAGRKATVLEQQRLSLGDSRSLDLRWTPKISRRTVGLKLTCRF